MARDRYEEMTGTASYRVMNGLQDLEDEMWAALGLEEGKSGVALVEKMRDCIQRVDTHSCRDNSRLRTISDEMRLVANEIQDTVDSFCREDNEEFLYGKISVFGEAVAALQKHECKLNNRQQA